MIETLKRNHIYTGDALEVAKTLPDGCLNCIITSPPYFGLRDYGVNGQGGLQETPQQYVEWLVTLFRELRRCLRDDGVLWLNLGDSYAHPNTGGNGATGGRDKSTLASKMPPIGTTPVKKNMGNFKPKDLIPIAWMTAMALQADGWYLRAPIIWSKPNPMPESVKDRVTISHEYIFMLTKKAHYWYDADAIAEPVAKDWTKAGGSLLNDTGWTNAASRNEHKKQNGVSKRQYDNFNQRYQGVEKRNKRSVWTINPQGSSRRHYAAFPEALVEPMLLAGCPEGGVCYDPFMGSGTVAVVARRFNRDYAGSELNPKYVAMALRRLAGNPTSKQGKVLEDVEAEDKPKTLNMFGEGE